MTSRIRTLAVAAALTVLAPLGALGAGAAPAAAESASTAAATASAPHSAAADPGLLTFGIQPKPADAHDTRSWFSLGATPGASSRDVALVTNFSDKALTLHVFATDAVDNADGEFEMLPTAQTPKDAGSWVKFDEARTFVTIPAHGKAELPFTLMVPSNATPGDHAGGVMVALTQPSVDAHGNRVNNESRVGVRIYVRIAGALRAELGVTAVSAVYHSNLNPFGDGSATVTYTITNTGNVRLGAKQAVHVSSLLGGSVQSAPIKAIEELLPGNSVTVTAHVPKVGASFTSTARLAVDPVARPGDLDPKLVGISKSAAMATVPWSVLILVALAAGLGFAVFRIRRRHRPGAPAAAGAGRKAARPAANPTAAPVG